MQECHGAGWVLTLIEGMRGEWGCTLEQAIFRESVNAAMVLWPALLARHGAEITVNHADKARQAAKKKKREEVVRNYTIIPTPAKDKLALIRGKKRSAD